MESVFCIKLLYTWYVLLVNSGHRFVISCVGQQIGPELTNATHLRSFLGRNNTNKKRWNADERSKFKTKCWQRNQRVYRTLDRNPTTGSFFASIEGAENFRFFFMAKKLRWKHIIQRYNCFTKWRFLTNNSITRKVDRLSQSEVFPQNTAGRLKTAPNFLIRHFKSNTEIYR